VNEFEENKSNKIMDENGYIGDKNEEVLYHVLFTLCLFVIEGFRHGVGQLTKDGPEGSSYIGNWKRNMRHGLGMTSNALGDKYIGEFRFGEQQYHFNIIYHH
jgi:hypothetical protein